MIRSQFSRRERLMIRWQMQTLLDHFFRAWVLSACGFVAAWIAGLIWHGYGLLALPLMFLSPFYFYFARNDGHGWRK